MTWRPTYAALLGCLSYLPNGSTAQTAEHFRDPATGITLSYPAGWQQQAGDLPANDPGLGYLGPVPMSFISEAGQRIVTLRMPGNAYPGTDFGTAYVTVSLAHDTPENCRNLGPNAHDAQAIHKTIGGIAFDGAIEEDAAMSHQTDERVLHGYRHAVCYEISYGLATAGFGAVDGITQVDRKEVFRRLQDVVDSIHFSPPSGS